MEDGDPRLSILDLANARLHDQGSASRIELTVRYLNQSLPHSIDTVCNFAHKSSVFHLCAEGQALDHHRHEAFSFHQLTDIDEIQFGQIDLVNAGKIPFRRKYAAHDSTHVLLENQSNRPIHRRQARYGFIDTPGQLLHHAITKKRWR